MRKPRVWPVVFTAAATAIILFGGWTLYKHTAVASPLHSAMNDIPGVMESSKPEVEQDQVNISLTLEDDANLRQVYEDVSKKSTEIAGSRSIHLQVRSESNDKLDELWSKSMFKVAEAMETKTYSKIPEAMTELTKDDQTVQTVTEMDDDNVYITLRSGDASKYVVLPRTPATMEVFANA
ncbi:hypothetical protein [Paenibacillus sp. HB172176]|uniref:hypothetical protein n=1 Tax=Paenibacillus sp. HB172176 TaxID=2493690 RepID=UPI00143B5C55|nr:hypothetical protein [Paenibacillus sp. HB172176]